MRIANTSLEKETDISLNNVVYLNDFTPPPQTNYTKSKSIKLIVVILIFLCWIIDRIINLFLKIDDPRKNDHKYPCFRDYIQTDIFKSLTIFFSQNLVYRDILLIFSSYTLDVALLSFFAIFIFYGKSWRPVVTMGLFYGFRGAFVQKLVLFQYPDIFIFLDPGFYSFAVSYEITPDFFYSGHCGCALAIFNHFRDFGYKKFSEYALFVCFMQFFTMITLRGHYSIDLIFGFLFSHYFFIISEGIAKFLDKYVNILGYEEVKKEKTELYNQLV